MTSTSGAKAVRPNQVGCTGGFLSRFLCTGLRVHGFDAGGGIRRAGGAEGELAGERWKAVAFATPAPGVVARLMGLETMPPRAGQETVEKVAAPYAARRSLSMSSIEGGWPPPGEEPGGPRFKKSSSFREIPTFLRPENDDFLLLTFGRDDDDERHEEISATKIETCLLELEEKSRDGRRRRGMKKNSTKAMDNNLKKTIDSWARTDSESSSQNSSPVSVLDRASESKAIRFIDLQEVPVTDCRPHSSPTGHRSWNPPSGREAEQRRRRLSEGEENPSQRNSRRVHGHRADVEIIGDLTPDVPDQSMSDTVTRSLPTQGIHRGKESTVLPPRGSPELAVEVCRLACEDVRRAGWVLGERKKKMVTFSEDVGVGVQVQIFDLLLREFVEELLFSPFLSTREP